MSEPIDELRYSVHMEMLKKSENAKDAGHSTVVRLGFAVDVALALIQRKETEARESAAFDMWLNSHDVYRDMIPELFTVQKAIDGASVAYSRVTGKVIADELHRRSEGGE